MFIEKSFFKVLNWRINLFCLVTNSRVYPRWLLYPAYPWISVETSKTFVQRFWYPAGSLSLILTLSWRRPSSCRNQSIHLLCKSVDWFLYGNGLRHARAKASFHIFGLESWNQISNCGYFHIWSSKKFIM